MPKRKDASIRAVIGQLKNDSGDSGTDVQAVIFPLTEEWASKKTREQWLVDFDYENNGYEKTDSGYKYEQTPEEEFEEDSLQTVPFGHPAFRDLDADQDETGNDETNADGNSERKRVIFRMTPSLHDRLREHADREDLSTNQLVCRALQNYLDDQNSSTGKSSNAQSRMQELRDLKEARDLLDPKKDKGLIEQLQEHIRQAVQQMTRAKQPAKKRWYEERDKLGEI